MTLALTKVTAFGVEADEAITKRFIQRVVIEGTAANTNVAYDLDANSGTFFTAVGATHPGSDLLTFLKEMDVRALTFLDAKGTGLATKSQESGGLAVIAGTIAGGAASTAAVVTGLLTTDVILAVTQNVKGANSLPLLGYNTQIADGLTVVYSADPGANGTIKVLVQRAAAVPAAGHYTLSLTANRPNITFITGDAPTTIKWVLSWMLKDGTEPLNFSVSA